MSFPATSGYPVSATFPSSASFPATMSWPGGGVAPSPPATPTGLAANPSDIDVTVSWDASVGATGYNLYRDGVLILSLAETSTTDTNVTPGTEYSYTVTATNAAGESAQSGAVTATPQYQMPANLVVAFEADSLSGLSNGAAFTSVADPFDGGNTWTTGTGSPTKETFRTLPVLYIPAAAIVSSNSVLDSSFDTACTVIYVALCDSGGSNQTVVSRGGIFGGIAMTEQGSGHLRFNQWFGKTGTNLARFGLGQVVGCTYDGAHVTLYRNTFKGDAEAYSSSLAVSGSVDFGAAAFSGAMSVRAAYLFDRCLTESEVQSVATYAAAKSAGLMGNNSYLFCGDSMTGSTGGTVTWYSAVQSVLDTNTVAYYYLWTDASSGWKLEDIETGIASNVAPFITAVNTSQYETAIIRAGTNNIAAGDTGAQVIAKLDSLMTALRANGINRIGLVGCLPATSDNGTKTAYKATYNAYMASIVSASVKFAAVQDDVRMQDPTDTTVYADGLHETDAGKAITAQITYDQALAAF